MLGDLAVSRCEKCSQCAENPSAGLHAGPREEWSACADDHGDDSGEENGENVDTAKDAVEGKISLAEALGELERTADQSEGAEEGVWEQQVAIGNEVDAVLVVERVIGNEKDFVGDEDEESGKTENEPERMFGGPARGRAGELRAVAGVAAIADRLHDRKVGPVT